MKKGFYLKLALTGISKNLEDVLPLYPHLRGHGDDVLYHLLFCPGIPGWLPSGGGDTLQLMLGMGTWITGIFAVIFLFYTNSFLIRRRKKEFGLYNMLTQRSTVGFCSGNAW